MTYTREMFARLPQCLWIQCPSVCLGCHVTVISLSPFVFILEVLLILFLDGFIYLDALGFPLHFITVALVQSDVSRNLLVLIFLEGKNEILKLILFATVPPPF